MDLNNYDDQSDTGAIERYDHDNRITSGEGLSPGPGAGLEYDLWEGQFQFVGQPSSRGSRLPRRRGPRLTEQVRQYTEIIRFFLYDYNNMILNINMFHCN